MRSPIGFHITVVFFALTSAAHAQAPQAPSSPTANQRDPRPWSWHLGGHYGAPLKASGAATVIWDIRRPDARIFASGPSLRFEVGFGGAKIAAGYTGLSTTYFSASSGRIAIIRTEDWISRPLAVDAGTTLVGGEYMMTGIGVSISLGIFTPTAGREHSNLIVTWTVGLGL